MSVDTLIHLPSHVDDDDVCEMAAICAGARARRHDFRGHEGWSAVVEGLSYEAHGHGRFPSLITVGFNDPLGRSRQLSYFPRGAPGGGPLLNPRSNPFWIALGRRLISVFGGEMIDCDSSGDISLSVPEELALLKASDFVDGNSEGFYNRQRALMSAYPLSAAELISASKTAEYGYDLDASGQPIHADHLAEVEAFELLSSRYKRLAEEERALADCSKDSGAKSDCTSEKKTLAL